MKGRPLLPQTVTLACLLFHHLGVAKVEWHANVRIYSQVRHSAGQFGRGSRGSSLSGRAFMAGIAKRHLLLPAVLCK